MVLTFALTRGMIRHGEGMTKIHFILMLSDFLLADGGLAALAEHIIAGRSAIFAPSWRVNDEQVEPQIEDWRDAQGAITIAPRSLAAVALRSLHPTVIGAMVEAGVLSMAHNNQFYWSVDDQTLVAHQLLMHLFCIRPERPIGKVNYYIDYGLFESCCPSSDHVVLDDSDGFMALERQSTWAEMERIQWGPANLASVAEDVGSWTTSVHRMLGRYACVLHGTDLPVNTTIVLAKSGSFIAELYARLPAALSDERRRLERELAEAKKALALAGPATSGGEDGEVISGIKVVLKIADGVSPKDLKGLADGAKQQIGSGVVAIVDPYC